MLLISLSSADSVFSVVFGALQSPLRHGVPDRNDKNLKLDAIKRIAELDGYDATKRTKKYCANLIYELSLRRKPANWHTALKSYL